MNRREFLVGSAAVATGGVIAAEEKTTDGGYAEVSWPERERREIPLLPAGAHSVKAFMMKCVGCGLCAAACPSKCLRPSDKPGRLGKIELDFRHGWCKPTCVRCGEVCPTGAIAKLLVKEKRDIHVGRATWRRDLCVRTTQGDECHACEKHCPVKAVKIVSGFPVIDRDACIGCGACEHYCPARPVTAIRVEGLECHREVRPMDESELIAEMRSVFEKGASFVVAKDGVIVFSSASKRLAPIDEALKKDPAMLRGAIVMDRVVGKAAAKRHIEAGVRKVVTPVIAKKAKQMLESAGISVSAGEIVEIILNRDRTGECPLDAVL